MSEIEIAYKHCKYLRQAQFAGIGWEVCKNRNSLQFTCIGYCNLFKPKFSLIRLLKSLWAGIWATFK